MSIFRSESIAKVLDKKMVNRQEFYELSYIQTNNLL